MAWQDEYMTMIEDCERRSDDLSDWEADFLDSIRIRLIDGKTLSTKQTERLEEIWTKATEGRSGVRR